MTSQHTVGLVLGSAISPERISMIAGLAGAGGFDEVWLAEDYFFTGGISGAGIVLSATEQVTVGLGVVSAVARHPALLAMEISTLARAYPARLSIGIGLGAPAWIRQMGLYPRSPLSALRECVTSIRRLLQGDELTTDGPTFKFERVRLTYPLSEPVPIHMGVTGPKMLRLSGEIADGSVLSVASGHAYVRWARARVDEGRSAAGRLDPHRISVFALYSVHEDPTVARDAVRGPLAFYKTVGGRNALTDVYGISEELERLQARGGYEAVRTEMPDRWVEDLTIAGSPEECLTKIRAFYKAGADAVALFPMPPDEVERVVALTSEKVLPKL